RAALVQTVIAVGVEGAAVAIDADLDLALADDADIAVLHLDVLAHENLLRHPSGLPCLVTTVWRHCTLFLRRWEASWGAFEQNLARRAVEPHLPRKGLDGD